MRCRLYSNQKVQYYCAVLITCNVPNMKLMQNSKGFTPCPVHAVVPIDSTGQKVDTHHIYQQSKKTAKIMKRYNQVPHLTQDTIWDSNKNTINITKKNHEVSPFPAGDHMAAMKRHESMSNTRHKKHK